MSEKMGCINMNHEQIKDLIKAVENSALTEFELKTEDAELKMKKEVKTVLYQDQSFDRSSTNAANVGTVSVSAEKERGSMADLAGGVLDTPITLMPDETPAKVEGHIITSPIVGTFYTTTSPDAPAYVSVGDTVEEGDVVCIVEAMKIMNEITSDFSGTVAEVYLESGTMAEYGQPLFRII